MKTKRVKKLIQIPKLLLLILAFISLAKTTKTATNNVLLGETIYKSVPVNLRVNLRAYPMGIDSHPAFGWDSKVTRQTAYQIQVVASLSDFKNGKFRWNSGKVKSWTDNQISYNGSALKSATRYYWMVCV